MIRLNQKNRIAGILMCGSLFVFLTGCQTAKPHMSKDETPEDVGEVLSAVAGAISGKTLSEDELKNLEHQIRTDEDAQSAITSITDSMGGNQPSVKYCPRTGKRYAAHLELCPEHQIELKIVGQ